MATNKPTNLRIWSETGANVDPGDLKYSAGWVIEIPTHQNMNFIQNQMSQMLKHINQEGIPRWDGDTEYSLGALTLGVDGRLYQANVVTEGDDPLTAPEWDDYLIKNVPDNFPTGTSIVFWNAAPPAGWTQDLTVDDSMLRVVSGAGGGSGGTDSPIAEHTHIMNAYTLSLAQIPAHSHGMGVNRQSGSFGLDFTCVNGLAASEPVQTSIKGSNNSFQPTNQNAFEPKYIDMVIGVKD